MAEDHSAMVEKATRGKRVPKMFENTHVRACVRACVWEKDCCAPEKLLMG